MCCDVLCCGLTHPAALRCAALCRPDGSRPEIYLKREDLNHTGAHKINNSLGQVGGRSRCAGRPAVHSRRVGACHSGLPGMLSFQIRCACVNEAAVCASSDGLPCPAAICAAALLRCPAPAQPPTSHLPITCLPCLPAAQALLCKRMGKKRIIAETGAGQHGVATVRTWGRGWLGGPACGASL